MKCEACGVENIYGSKTCKSCASLLNTARAGVSSPPPPPLLAPVAALGTGPTRSVSVEQPMRNGHPELGQVGANSSGHQELDFIPYSGNVHFNYFVRGLRFALDFKGRTGRAGFWYFTLFQLLILIVLQVVSPMLADLAVLVTLVPTVSIWFRRLHDTDRSGLWLLACLIPVVGLVLIYFAAQASKPEDNAWGPEAVAQD